MNYITQFEQLYHGGNWLEESFEGKLYGLSDHKAFEAPVPGVHSVAEIVWHCIYWRLVLIKRLEGNNNYRDETFQQMNFLPLEDLQKKGWPEIRRELDETQVSLIKLLHGKHKSFFETEYQQGRTYDYVVEGTIHHDLYHLGQIGLVLKILTMKDGDGS